MLVQRLEDRLHDAIRIRQHVVVPETEHEVSLQFQDPRPGDVLLSSLHVLATIKLNDEPSIDAHEVDNITINRCLPAELPTRKAPIAQTKPKHPLRIGLIAAQSSGGADVSLHDRPSLHIEEKSHAGRATCSTSPRWGEVGARSAPGEGEQTCRESLAPSPQPSPLRGEGARPVLGFPSANSDVIKVRGASA